MGSGWIATGRPISQESMIAPMIMMSRDTTTMASQPGSTPMTASADVDRDEQRLVGDGVEIGAELGAHVEAPGDEAVDGVRSACHDEQQEGSRPLPLPDHDDHEGHEEQAADRDQIRDGHAGTCAPIRKSPRPDAEACARDGPRERAAAPCAPARRLTPGGRTE